jgi:hypothetical protein
MKGYGTDGYTHVNVTLIWMLAAVGAEGAGGGTVGGTRMKVSCF